MIMAVACLQTVIFPDHDNLRISNSYPITISQSQWLIETLWVSINERMVLGRTRSIENLKKKDSGHNLHLGSFDVHSVTYRIRNRPTEYLKKYVTGALKLFISVAKAHTQSRVV